MTGLLAVMPGILGLILAGLQAWLAAAPQRKQETLKDEDEKLREECLALDAAAISVRVDNVLHPPTDNTTRQ